MSSDCKAHTLLRYPGGKGKAVKTLLPYFEATEADSLISPFFGGGAIELALVREGWDVSGFDGWKPVVNFWKSVLKDPSRVADLVEMFRPVSKLSYLAMQGGYERIQCPWTRAATFYTLNRCAHTGTGLTGGKTHWRDKSAPRCTCGEVREDGTDGNPRLTDSNVQKLRDFKAPTLTVEHSDFTDSALRRRKSLMYLDPPYYDTDNTPAMRQLYAEHVEDKGRHRPISENFDHERLAKILHKRENWILSYNNIKEVRELYSSYTMKKPRWSYGHQHRSSNELLILSHDLSHLIL